MEERIKELERQLAMARTSLEARAVTIRELKRELGERNADYDDAVRLLDQAKQRLYASPEEGLAMQVTDLRRERDEARRERDTFKAQAYKENDRNGDLTGRVAELERALAEDGEFSNRVWNLESSVRYLMDKDAE